MLEILWAVGSLILLVVILFFMRSMPYKYNPLFYINNVFFIEPIKENPQLAKSVFGKVAIRYREDIVDNGMIFFGEMHLNSDEDSIGETISITNVVDVSSFGKIEKPVNESSVSTHYQDKKFQYVVNDLSDGIYLHIYERKNKK